MCLDVYYFSNKVKVHNTFDSNLKPFNILNDCSNNLNIIIKYFIKIGLPLHTHFPISDVSSQISNTLDISQDINK